MHLSPILHPFQGAAFCRIFGCRREACGSQAVTTHSRPLFVPPPCRRWGVLRPDNDLALSPCYCCAVSTLGALWFVYISVEYPSSFPIMPFWWAEDWSAPAFYSLILLYKSIAEKYLAREISFTILCTYRVLFEVSEKFTRIPRTICGRQKNSLSICRYEASHLEKYFILSHSHCKKVASIRGPKNFNYKMLVGTNQLI